jgi:dipeptidyl aminopeptidase/acylaminoacyl peptidase
MGSLFVRHALLGLIHLVSSALLPGWTSSPLSWSPDSQWLSYTVAPSLERDGQDPGWLFDAARDSSARQSVRIASRVHESSCPTAYKVWATRRDGGPSVLIEQSAWPLTAPLWSPLGRSIAFARFVPDSIETAHDAPRGRLEVVIQDALDRKRVLLSLLEFELDPDARESFASLAAAWSPDGQFLAFPKPGRQPALLIIKTDSRRLLRVLDQSVHPAWSPDGSKLAFVRATDQQGTLQVIERHGQTFTDSRTACALGRVGAAPAWSSDGRSILAVRERAGARSQELELVRVSMETADVQPFQVLAPDVVRRGAEIRGIAVDLDRDEERCFFAVDFAGRDTEVVWSIPRDRIYYKRFHPIDISLRVDRLAISPDGHALAVRFGQPDALTPPAMYDPPTEHVSLLAPDEAARRSWLAVLAGTACSLLLAGLPTPSVDGQVGERPTIFPAPGEIPANDVLFARLRRLGRLGSALCDRPPLPDGPGELEERHTTPPEDRLFFNYLRGHFASALVDLDALEDQISSPDQRLALLSVRAQLLWFEAESLRAREIVGYLRSTVGGPISRVEVTPLGLSLTPDPHPRQTWVRYLSARITEGAPAPSTPQAEPAPERIELRPFNPLVPPELPVPERGDGVRAVPFDPRPFPGAVSRPMRPHDVPPPPPMPIDRPLRVPR